MKSNKTTTAIAIMTLFFMSMGIGAVTPALADIAKAFPNIPFTTIALVTTLPSLFIIPATIVSGALLGTKVSYRMMTLMSMVLFTVFGIAPYFFRDFTAILVARAGFGIAMGLASPIANALIFKLIDGPKVPGMMGLGTVIMNVGGIVMQMVAGILCAINWALTFFVFLFGALAFFIVLIWLPEPPKEEQMQGGEKVKMPLGVYGLSAVFGLLMMLMYPLLLNMSTIIVDGNLGNAAAAGAVLSLWTVGGMAAGAVFGTIVKILKKLVIPVSLVVAVLGLIVVIYAKTLLILTVGAVIIGIAFSLVMPAFMMDVGAMVPPAATAKAISAVMVAINVGGFISTFYIGALIQVTGNTDVRFHITISMVCYFVIAVLLGVYKLKGPAKTVPPPAA
ncbi:MAG: MFS transporter [Clostridiales bacterium]|nr:MFS transporter [Eubacteriales bacterium]MDH7567436.1 MFS transporter [Clostridiales bacterium]